MKISFRFTMVLGLCIGIGMHFALVSNAMAQDKLTILTEENPPWNYSENGKVTGFTTDVVNQLLKETGNEDLPIHMLSWSRAYRTAREDANVLLYTTTRTPKRETLFKWVGPIAKRVIWIWKLKKRKDIRIRNLEDAKNYNFAIVSGAAGTLYLLEQGFTKKQLDYVPHDSLALNKFLHEKNDLVCKMKLGMAFSLRKRGKSMDFVEPVFQLPSGGEYYLAFSLGTPDEVVDKFQKALEKIKKNRVFDRIKAKWIN